MLASHGCSNPWGHTTNYVSQRATSNAPHRACAPDLSTHNAMQGLQIRAQGRNAIGPSAHHVAKSGPAHHVATIGPSAPRGQITSIHKSPAFPVLPVCTQDSKSEGTMLKETTNINKSLFVLGKVRVCIVRHASPPAASRPHDMPRAGAVLNACLNAL